MNLLYTSDMATLAELEKTLATKSYLSGYSCSNADVEAVNKFGVPNKKSFPNTYRWAVHICALEGIVPTIAAGGAAPAAKADDDDELDLFGDDDEEDEAAKAEALKAAKKAKVQ